MGETLQNTEYEPASVRDAFNIIEQQLLNLIMNSDPHLISVNTMSVFICGRLRMHKGHYSNYCC